MAGRFDASVSTDDARSIQFLPAGPQIPLDLIRARDAGEVVFIVGAGASKSSGLPLFAELTSTVFKQLLGQDPSNMEQVQRSVFKAYKSNSFDFVLGYLEQRIDGGQPDGKRPRLVRQAVAEALTAKDGVPIHRHSSLIVLARNPRGEPRLVTTNFDTLLERAWQASPASPPLVSRSGADLPGPGTIDFNGVLHLHGRLRDECLPAEITGTDLVLTDVDFGDAYLRSGWAARFLYDLVRRYTIVLVGYGAEDPPLKYLLSVIGADRSRFSDLRPIYAFAHSSASEADDVTGEWLAKGVNPILYEPGQTHEQLYDTLAEWALYVDDPLVWADSHVRKIGARHYDELENHERSILELIFVSPTNCSRARAAGADFSLIRAIEASRPPAGFQSKRGGAVQGSAESYLNSLVAWIWSGMATLDAAAWAVARQAPQNQISIPREGESPSGEERQPHSMTQIRGMSGEETAILKRQYRHNYKNWSREFAEFWYLFLLAADGHAAEQPEMAYEILERLKQFSDNPLLGDAKQLAEFMAPTLQVSHFIRWGAEHNTVEHPHDLADFRHHWNKHPGHEDIAAALPDNIYWLKYFLHYLEHEITELYALTQQIDRNFGLDWLNRTCHSVASSPSPGGSIEGVDWTDPDRYSTEHVPLIRLTSAAWRRLRDLDRNAARQVAFRWASREERLFVRLHIWTINDRELWTPEEVGRALENVPDDAFWRPDPEVALAIVYNWASLQSNTQRRLDQRLMNPPRIEDKDPERANTFARWYKHTATDMLFAIAKNGNELSEEATKLIAEVKASGIDPEGIAGLVSRGPQVVSIPPAEAGSLAELEGEQLVVALLDDLNREEFDGGSRAEAVVRADPGKVLKSLTATTVANPGKLWRKLYSFYALPNSTASSSHETKSALLSAIQELPPDVLSEAAHAAADWLEKITVGPDDSVMPFLREKQGAILNSWRHLAQYAFRTGEAERFSSNQGERLMSQALNRPAGVLAFIGIALADRGQRDPKTLPVLEAFCEDIDNILSQASGPSRTLVAARISQWLGLCERLLPNSTEKLVLLPLLSDPPDLSLLDLHLLFGRGMSEYQYRRLEALLLNEARNGSLSQQGNQRNVEALVWRSLDQLAGLTDDAPAHAELRSILQRTTVENRTSVARVCRTWFLRQDAGDRAGLWDRVGEPFFKSVWPLDAALRHPAVSQELMRLPPVISQSFERVVSHILMLVVQFPLYDIRSMFIGLMEGSNYEKLKDIAKSFVADHWDAFLDMLDAALGPSPTTIPYDLAEWLNDLSQSAPASKDDSRFRRLIRLAQQ